MPTKKTASPASKAAAKARKKKTPTAKRAKGTAARKTKREAATTTHDTETFGERLIKFRKQAGFSQRELGEHIGLSQRMVAYYEGQTSHAPDQLLPVLADVLGVSIDALLGVRPASKSPKPINQRLWRRFRQIEGLPARDRQQLLAVVDAVLERHRLVQRAP